MKKLTVRTNDYNSYFVVTASNKKIAKLIKWAHEYNHGTYNGTDTIFCNTHVDFMACRRKAIYESMLQPVSPDEIKTQFAL